MKYRPLNPDDIAKRLGRGGMPVRTLLRQLYPGQAPGSGGRWLLTEEQVAAVLAYFQRERSASAAIGNGPPGVDGAEVPSDWFGGDMSRTWLSPTYNGGAGPITAVSDTAARAQG